MTHDSVRLFHPHDLLLRCLVLRASCSRQHNTYLHTPRCLKCTWAHGLGIAFEKDEILMECLRFFNCTRVVCRYTSLMVSSGLKPFLVDSRRHHTVYTPKRSYKIDPPKAPAIASQRYSIPALPNTLS